MFNLYWKVFLGFWLSSLVLGGSAVLISLELRSIDPLDIQNLEPVRLMRQTSFVLHRLPAELEAWQQQLSTNGVSLYTSSRAQTALTRPSFPADISKLFDQLERDDYVASASFTRVKIGRRETSPDGRDIKFILDMPSGMVFSLRELIGRLSVQFVLALSLSGLVCFLLARYLTRNLQRISSASRALAAGDLSARVELTSDNRGDDLSQLAEDFNFMAGELERSAEQQRRLVRDISHELRSPLARLQIALALAQQSGNSEELERIGREADRLNDMIEQLLSMPEDSTQLDDVIDLVEMTRDIISNCAIEASVKRVVLEFNCTLEEVLVKANSHLLHSAIENVLRNAIRYTDDDTSIGISVVLGDNNTCAISIVDHGPGVPEDDIANIFKPFYRVDAARNRGTGGYGIGLAIVERAARQHGGMVSAKNVASGLQVTLTLPRLCT